MNSYDILLWTPTCGHANASQAARTYLQQLSIDTGCSLEDLPGAMNNRDGWRERERESRESVLTVWDDDNDDYILKYINAWKITEFGIKQPYN